MNHEALGKLIDRWTSDVEFRAAVRRDPLAAIAAAGVRLTDDEKAAVSAFDWSVSDADLPKQIKAAM